jgi:hypothetical protein
MQKLTESDNISYVESTEEKTDLLGEDYTDALYCIDCGALLDRSDRKCYRCGAFQD